jgi:hypothetical protein
MKKIFKKLFKKKEKTHFYPADVWSEVAEKYNIRENLWELFKASKDYFGIEEGIVIYGEIYGAGIQKNYDYGLEDIEYAGFDVTINGQYCDTARSWAIHNIMKLDYVPILYTGNWSQEIQDSFVFDNFIEGTKVPHEGIVIKNIDGNRHKVAKVINPDYLIYGEKHNVGDSH